MTNQYTPKDIARFWTKVNKTDSCWLWTGCLMSYGYGGFQHRREGGGFRLARAHVVSYELSYGPIPDGMCVLHNCPDGDNPACVNPDHLWVGTQQENIADKVRKGRQARGERDGMSKLTAETVRKIRARYVPRVCTYEMLAKMYGISTATAFEIVHRKIWKHII